MVARGRVTIEVEFNIGEGGYINAIADAVVAVRGVTSVRTRDHEFDQGDGVWHRGRQGSRLSRERVPKAT